MYARKLKCRCQNLGSFLQRPYSLFRPTKRDLSLPWCSNIVFCRNHPSTHIAPRNFSSVPVFYLSNRSYIGKCKRHCPGLRYRPIRFYSADSDGQNANEDEHVPVKGTDFETKKDRHEELVVDSKHSDEHARLGIQDLQDWLDFERFSIDSKKKESPFLIKRKRFKNEILRRVVPWEKISVSLKTFPYFIHDHAKKLLLECVFSHLKHTSYTSSYGACLPSSRCRILLESVPGTELYRERLVRALARDLHIPLLILDSTVLAPYDFGQGYESESEIEDKDVPEEECMSDSESEASEGEECASGNNAKSGESDDSVDVDVHTFAAIKKLIPAGLEEFVKTVASEIEATPGSGQSESDEPSQESKRPLRKGDRVKYIGAPVHMEVGKRIILGKVPTSDGSTNAYTYLSQVGWTLTSEQRGEVYEVNGDQVAVTLDNNDDKQEKDNEDENNKEQASKPPICWIDIQHLVRDLDTQAEEWYMAIEALREVLPSLQPIIVYFPDPSQWLSRAVPKSKCKDFIQKVEEMFDQLSGPVIFIGGQNKSEIDAGSKRKEKHTMVFANLGPVAKLPVPLKRLTEGLTAGKYLKGDDMYKLFTNTLFIHPPKEDASLRTFIKQIEKDRRIIISMNNLIELQKVLEEHELLCEDLWHVKTDGVILTKQKAEMTVGWARNHYLSCSTLPSMKGERLMVPCESLEIAMLRLRQQETVSRERSLSLKNLARDEYERNFVSAVVSPDEIGVKFDDIGALEDVKRTLSELVTLPMRRPELFSHGNLLRPCKGILLFGPPGTGKTLLAKALATEAGATFISITGSALTSKWFGDAEKLTKALFSFARRLSPVIIFVDEIDSLLGARGCSSEHESTRRMRNEFMAAWDGLRSKDDERILILGATNRPFDLDDAVIRRLPRRIYVDLPDAANRLKILRIFLSQEKVDPDVRLEELANVTEGYSGSDLKNLCIAAAYQPVQELLEEIKKEGRSGTTPLRPLELDDFIKAKAKVGPSVPYDAASMNALRKWNEQYGEGGSRRRTPFGF